MVESVSMEKETEDKALFYDDKVKKWILVDKRTFDVWSADSKDKLLAVMGELR